MPDATGELSVLTGAGGQPVSYPLAVNCRNTREIAAQVEFLSGIRIEEVAFVDGPGATDAEWSDEKVQAKRLRATLLKWLEEGVPVESIVILSPRRFESSVASKVEGAPKPIVDTSGERPEPDPDTIAFSTIHAYKGLESEAVLLVDVDDLDSERMRALLYVGGTRSRTILGVLRSSDTTPTFSRRVVDRSNDLATAPAPIELG